MIKPRHSANRLLGIAACSLCLLLPALAGSAEPAVNAQALGMMESVLHFCGPVNAKAAAELQAKVASMVKGASAVSLRRVRQSAEYQQSYQSVADLMGDDPEQNAKRVCTETVGDK